MSKETGGFAFPSKVSNLSNEKQNIYGYDVPPGDSFIAGGMTLRDYFAAKALQGILSAGIIGVRVGPSHTEEMEGFAKKIYTMADAMIAARGK